MSKHLLLRYVSRALGQRSSGDAYAIPKGDSDGHTTMELLFLLHKYRMIVRHCRPRSRCDGESVGGYAPVDDCAPELRELVEHHVEAVCLRERFGGSGIKVRCKKEVRRSCWRRR